MSQKKAIRRNPFCVVSKETFGDSQRHDIQMNTSWNGNPYGDKYVVVPDEMVQDILETKGFCDIVLSDNETEVVSFTAREIPQIVETEQKPTIEERLTALEMAMLEQIGVEVE